MPDGCILPHQHNQTVSCDNTVAALCINLKSVDKIREMAYQSEAVVCQVFFTQYVGEGLLMTLVPLWCSFPVWYESL